MYSHSWLLLLVITVLEEVNSVAVDLSHSYRNYTSTCWKPTEHFDISAGVVRNGPNGWYATESFTVSEHCGTHIDAPYHFCQTGWKLGDIPLERLIVQGVHVNVSREVNGNGDFVLTADHLRAWETVNGRMPCRSVILINFGWAHMFDDRRLYYNNNTGGTLRFPGISKDAAQWIVDSKKAYGVGVDGPSVDPGYSVLYDAHKILAKANVYNLENVALNGTTLPSKGFKLVIQPVKIAEGTGAPSRILAFTNDPLP